MHDRAVEVEKIQRNSDPETNLEKSPVFTAGTHRHQNFQTQTKDLSFSAGLSLNFCSSIRFVFILFYFIFPRAMLSAGQFYFVSGTFYELWTITKT